MTDECFGLNEEVGQQFKKWSDEVKKEAFEKGKVEGMKEKKNFNFDIVFSMGKAEGRKEIAKAIFEELEEISDINETTDIENTIEDRSKFLKEEKPEVKDGK